MDFILAQQPSKPLVPVGIFLGSIEEGARIFTPVRLLPFNHPEAEGHQFPNALQLYGPSWMYKEFSQPDTSHLRDLPCIKRPLADAPLRGLRAVLYVNKKPVCFIVDTRKMTLKARGMTRATSMGLDINRSDFLRALDEARRFVDPQSTAAVIFR